MAHPHRTRYICQCMSFVHLYFKSDCMGEHKKTLGMLHTAYTNIVHVDLLITSWNH